MAEKQTRCSISVSKDFYAFAKKQAGLEGVSVAQWITDIVRRDMTARGIEVPASTHMRFEHALKAVVRRSANRGRHQ